MTHPRQADRTPEEWEAEALAERVRGLPKVTQTQRAAQTLNPYMIFLTIVWVVLLIVSGSIQSASGGGTDSPAALITLLSAGAVALAQVIVLALRWEPRT